MPRRARLDAPGTVHHIMIRGIERRPIFLNDQDREDFIKRLDKLLPETKSSCYAWVFMNNHAHFLLRSGTDGISKLMKRLLTGYVVTFNLRHQRHGQLFQNRYKSIICQEDLYLKELVRYIHLNPIRGYIISDLEQLGEYKYSGHSALTGRVKRPWQDVEYVLREFGGTLGEGRRQYLAYIEKTGAEEHRNDLSGGGLIRSLGGWTEVKIQKKKIEGRLKGDERILGQNDFVTKVLSEANERLNHKYALQSNGYDLRKIVAQVSEDYQIDVKLIYSQRRQRRLAEARSLICHFAVHELGLKLTDLAKEFKITPAAVGYAAIRGEKVSQDRKYNLQME